MKVELQRINFAVAPPPKFKEARGADWYLYGERNNFPEELLKLYNESPLHNAIITQKAQFIAGKDTSVQLEGTVAQQAGAMKALQAATDTLSNAAMRVDAQQVLVLVREGAPLASAMAQHPRFPRMLAMFSRLGEQTGTLPTMLKRAADQLSEEVQRRALQLASLLEPLLIVAMGGMVMLIVLAVMLPIIQLNTWVR